MFLFRWGIPEHLIKTAEDELLSLISDYEDYIIGEDELSEGNVFDITNEKSEIIKRGLISIILRNKLRVEQRKRKLSK
jgi:hypothetical protein